MRPVDAKITTVPTHYDNTFSNIPGGGRGVVVHQVTYKKAPADPVYTFFRNGTTFSGGSATPQAPGKGFHAPVAHPTQQFVVNATTRGGGASLTVQPYIQQYSQKHGSGYQQMLRVLLPREVAADLLRLFREDEWNGTDFFPPVPHPPATADPAARTSVVEALERGMGLVDKPPAYASSYGASKPELLTTMGGFCSYCEVKYPSGRDLDVEHRLPKKFYPTETLRWENFLLGCSLCNSDIKGTQPTRSFGIERALETVFAGQGIAFKGGATVVKAPLDPATTRPIPFHEILNAANRWHVWPDMEEAMAGGPAIPTLRMVRYELCEVMPNGSLRPLKMAQAVDRRSGYHSTTDPDQVLRTDIFDTHTNRAAPMRVAVRATPRTLSGTATATINDRMNAGAANTIRLVGLDRRTDASRDQRMISRTEAWFAALRACELLSLLLDAGTDLRKRRLRRPPVIPSVDDAWNVAVSGAEGGYYSVWVTVFKHAGSQAMARQLVTRLQDKSTGDAHSHARYHGSNVNRSVVPFLKDL